MTTTEGISDEELITSWGLVIEGVVRTRRNVLAAIEETGLPGNWFEALHLLLDADQNRLPMNRLARDLAMTAGGLTKLADRMARAGLIDRRNSIGDRRVVYASLTVEGEALARRTLKVYQQSLREHLSGPLTGQQIDVLTELMGLLLTAHSQTDVPIEEQVAQPRDPALPDRRGADRTV